MERSRDEALAMYAENERAVKFTLKQLGLFGDRDREDLLQEGRLALWRACLSYDPERGSMKALGWIAVRRAILDCVRRSSAHKRQPVILRRDSNLPYRPPELPPASAPREPDHISAQERRELVKR